ATVAAVSQPTGGNHGKPRRPAPRLPGGLLYLRERTTGRQCQGPDNRGYAALAAVFPQPARPGHGLATLPGKRIAGRTGGYAERHYRGRHHSLPGVPGQIGAAPADQTVPQLCANDVCRGAGTGMSGATSTTGFKSSSPVPRAEGSTPCVGAPR